MESAHTAGGTLCIGRERGNSLKCRLRNCRMRNSSIHCRCRWLLLCKCRVSYCFVFVVTDAKIATIFEYPKIILLSLIKIAGCSLKIAIRHPKISGRYLKISGLKIAGDSLKISGLKIIARVCVYVCAWVRGFVGAWVHSHLANISKIEQDATRAQESSNQSDHHRTQEHKRPPQEPKHSRHPAHAYRKRN